MAQISPQLSALRQYQSNAISSPFTSPTRAGKVAPLDVRTSQPQHENTQVSNAGDTLKVSGTASTRAEVQAATAQSQTVQAGLTTATVVNDSLRKTQGVLGQMTSIVERLGDAQQPVSAQERTALQKDFVGLAGQLNDLVESETFAGHKVLDGRFKVSFSMGDDQQAVIDVTLPNGKSFDVSGLGLDGVTAFMNSAAAAAAQGQAPQISLPTGSAKGLEVAAGAVAQVRSGVSQAAVQMVGKLNGPDAPFGAPVGGASQLASQLVAAARASVLANPAQALGAQANATATAVSRLLVG